MGVRDSELCMASAQISNRRNKRLQMIKPLHDHGQSLDELPALVCQVDRLEEWPSCWINLEKPIVEQARCRVCHRRNFPPGLFHKCFLFTGHWMLQHGS